MLRAEYLLPVRRIVFVDTSRAIPNWLAPMSAFVSMVDLNNLQAALATGGKAEEEEEKAAADPSSEVVFEPEQESVLWTLLPAYMRTMFGVHNLSYQVVGSRKTACSRIAACQHPYHHPRE